MALSPPDRVAHPRSPARAAVDHRCSSLGLRDVAASSATCREGAADGRSSPVEGVASAVDQPVPQRLERRLRLRRPRGARTTRLRGGAGRGRGRGHRQSDAEQQLAELSAVARPAVRRRRRPRSRPRSCRGRGPTSRTPSRSTRARDDGVTVGMPVVTGGGLVGRVSQATAGTLDGRADHRPRVPGRRAPGRAPATWARPGARAATSRWWSTRPSTPAPRCPAGTGVVTSGVDRSAYPDGHPGRHGGRDPSGLGRPGARADRRPAGRRRPASRT